MKQITFLYPNHFSTFGALCRTIADCCWILSSLTNSAMCCEWRPQSSSLGPGFRAISEFESEAWNFMNFIFFESEYFELITIKKRFGASNSHGPWTQPEARTGDRNHWFRSEIPKPKAQGNSEDAPKKSEIGPIPAAVSRSNRKTLYPTIQLICLTRIDTVTHF